MLSLPEKTAVLFQRKREIVEENLRKVILQNTRNILLEFESKSTPLFGDVQSFKKVKKFLFRLTTGLQTSSKDGS
ncbi:MAG: hypothetical protein DBY41_07000 [Clostridium sp.]|nr:MAG: hypothetical protein DBY41_07000 [Clostridium sp.]